MPDIRLGSPNEKCDSEKTVKVLSSEVRLVIHIPELCIRPHPNVRVKHTTAQV